LLPIFQSLVQFQLGAGTLLQFWHDSWMQQPLKLQYPHLFEQVRYTDISVADSYRQDHWRIYVNDSLDPTAQQELQDLINKLSCVRIKHEKDQISWLRCESRKFSVKTAYAFIHDTPHVDSRLLKIWEIKAPQRVQMFCWLQARNKILTIDQMIRRGWIVTNMCYLCRENLETRNHIFRECSYATQLRQYVMAAIPVTRQPCQAYLSATNDIDILIEGHSMYWRQMELTTIFVIWRERCRRIFQGATQDIVNTAREIFRKHKQWFCSSIVN
jgi:disulfide oxidoreductase YuzD